FYNDLDWTSNDIYPILGHGPLGLVGQALAKLLAWSRPRPQFQYIEASAITGGRDPADVAPTAGEFRAELWDAIIHGARGIFYFPHTGCDPCTTPDGTTPELQAEMTAQNARITSLAPVLQGDIDPPGLVPQATAPLELSWRRAVDGTYIIVLNLSPAPVAM